MEALRFISNTLQTEIIYSFVIIVCSLMIYFGTKELYELSSYKGIKYLRKSFLFFAVAYFFRSFIKIFFIIMSPPRIMNYSPVLFQFISLFIFIYFSSMAVFYLVYSMMWKKWKNHSNRIYIFHILALAASSVSIFFNSAKIYLMINVIIFVFITIMIYSAYHNSEKHSKKKLNLYAIYILLFIFWILNVLEILIPELLRTFQLIVYLASLGIFLSILYKVLKKSGSN